MTTRDVRDLIVDAIEADLRRRGCPHPRTAALAAAAIVEGQGIALLRPAHHHDPDADWRQEPAPQRITPADAADTWQAAREQRRRAAGLPPTDPTPPEKEH
jgi:hypothetical protein